MPMSDEHSIFLSIVIPVYNEESVLREFIKRTQSVAVNIGGPYEMIFVNDGSTDATLKLLQEQRSLNDRIKIVDFSRNYGHQIAITAGIDHAKGELVVTMDGDLQHPPELIPEMIKKCKDGCDVVHAKKIKRLGEGVFKRWTAGCYYRLVKVLSNVEIPINVADFRLLNRRAVQALKKVHERHRYIRGLIAWIGFKQGFVEFESGKRIAGKSKYTMCKMLRLSLDGIFSFSVLPLRAATMLGLISSFLSFTYILYALYTKLVLNAVISGWTSVIIAICFLGGVQLICLGIVGEYIGLIHDETRKRPLYIISDIYE